MYFQYHCFTSASGGKARVSGDDSFFCRKFLLKKIQHKKDTCSCGVKMARQTKIGHCGRLGENDDLVINYALHQGKPVMSPTCALTRAH